MKNMMVEPVQTPNHSTENPAQISFVDHATIVVLALFLTPDSAVQIYEKLAGEQADIVNYLVDAASHH
jgi:hypothetical protein